MGDSRDAASAEPDGGPDVASPAEVIGTGARDFTILVASLLVGLAAGYLVSRTSSACCGGQWVVWSAVVSAMSAVAALDIYLGVRAWNWFGGMGSTDHIRVGARLLWPLLLIVPLVWFAWTADEGATWTALALLLIIVAGAAPAGATLAAITLHMDVALGRADAWHWKATCISAVKVVSIRLMTGLGALISLATIALAAAIDMDVSGRLPRESIAIFGVTSTALAALVYIPTAAVLRADALRLHDSMLPPSTVAASSAVDWLKDRDEFVRQTVGSRGLLGEVQAAVAILGPLVAGGIAGLLQ